ncbi:unnamed protein product [Rotaria magnacalcarata]|nr:unnamed protein product [Rotaria magnacalcarata]CAF1682676.1 unnamed protein product [Rotaria magnacalcarata]CAF3967805.1 unnamed protein product [Rotaria magnacalcarata]CAF3971068.1 unnamed protein product [Rotaria magnacalcarata]CAF3994956.1 unnamed protein product [Rotaria magnacalcarata]
MIKEKTSKYLSTDLRQVKLTESIVKDLIIECGLPISLVDQDGFNSFMATVDPMYSLLTRRQITRDKLPKLHDRMTMKLKALCNNAEYVSVTLDKKLVRLITDNASNNLKAFNHILLPCFESYFENDEYDNEEYDLTQDENDDCEEISDDNSDDKFQLVPLDENIIQCVSENLELLCLPCFAYTLQLVVNDGIKHASNANAALAKVAKIAKFSHSSILFAEELENLKKTIPRATKCRWNSQFLTVVAVSDIPLKTLNDVLIKLDKKELCITEKNKEVLDELLALLYLFNEATVLTQADQTVTISMVGPILLNLLSDLELERKKSERVYLMCDALISSLKTRFGGFYKHFSIETDNCKVKINTNANTSCLYGDPIFLMSAVVDGRFKFQWINDCTLLSDVTKTNIISTIKQCLIEASIKLNSQNKFDNADVEIITEEARSDDSNIPTSDKEKKKNIFPTLASVSFKKAKVDNATPKSFLDELDGFLKEDNMTHNFIFKNASSYQSLYHLARKIMCAPATSALIERVFSQSGLLMRPHRSKFSQVNICILTSLKCNKTLL